MTLPALLILALPRVSNSWMRREGLGSHDITWLSHDTNYLNFLLPVCQLDILVNIVCVGLKLRSGPEGPTGVEGHS